MGLGLFVRRFGVLLVGVALSEKQLDEVGEKATVFVLEKILIGAHFGDGAVVHHEYFVALWQKAQRVGYKQARFVFKDAVGSDDLVEQRFANVGVYCAQWVV